MRKKKIIELAHQLLIHHVKQDDIIIDATVGNGYDTLFLSDLAKHVYGFDIQEDALTSAKEKLEGKDNITLIHDSFENFSNHVGFFNGIVFNLGYLPNGDKTITTETTTTLNTIKHLLTIKNIFILIVVYPGHEEGLNESLALKDYFSTLSNPVVKIQIENRENAPFIYFIEN